MKILNKIIAFLFNSKESQKKQALEYYESIEYRKPIKKGQ